MEFADSKHKEKKLKGDGECTTYNSIIISVGDNDKSPEADRSETHKSHKSKKKKKDKDLEKCDQSNLQKKRLESSKGMKEEWPQLGSISDSNSQKRKSSHIDMDDQKDRPMKLVKHLNDNSTSISKTGCNMDYYFDDFSEELASWQRDFQRISKIRRKKQIEDQMKTEVENADDSKLNKSHSSCTFPDEERGDLPSKKDYKKQLETLQNIFEMTKKQLKLQELASLRLKGEGKEADLNQIVRTPILSGDVQNLLLLSQLGQDTVRYPRWMQIKKHKRLCKTIVLVVEGASAYDLFSMESQCAVLANMDIKAEMVTPYCYSANIAEELCAVPITRQQKKQLEKRYGKEICPEALVTDRIIKVLRSAFSISSVAKTSPKEVEQKISVPSTDKFPRTDLLLSVWQLIEEGYPLPYGCTDLGNRYPDYVMTKDEYKEVTPSSPMWALDCEMCLTRAGNELTRVSVVNEQHETVYESLCMPPNPIKNYQTEYSGITPQMLRGVTTKLEDIQRDLRNLFPPDVILVGQSLGSDLHALKMLHPYVIDTSVIFNLSGNRRHKSKLSKLSMEFLNEAIQNRGAKGHDSVEDSLAALKLVQLKLTKNIAYGDAVLSGLEEQSEAKKDSSLNSSYPEHSAEDFQDLQLEVGPIMATSLFKHFTMRKKKVAVIGQEETLTDYSAFIAAAHRENKQLITTHTTSSNLETINTACQESKTNNFTFAHVVLSEEESLLEVDSWVAKLMKKPPFNSLFIVVLAGSHNSFANGACLATIKKPCLKLEFQKTD